ncbi:MAG: stage III sporulation protein AB [Bacillota bacterium]
MLKLLGAALTLAMPALVGFRVAARYGRRPAELRALQTGLAVLVTEVEYGLTPLPGALRSAGRAAGGPAGSILLDGADRLERGGGITPAEALAAAIGAGAETTCFTTGDLEVLRALAGVLGASGRHDQVRHIRLALERLAGAEAEAGADRARYEPVCRYAGVLSGLALLLILY